jgi:hypothetical protein
MRSNDPTVPDHHSQKLLRLERFLSRTPFGLAETAGLKRLNDAKSLFDRTPDVEVVDDLVTEYAFRIDDEQSSQSDAAIFD